MSIFLLSPSITFSWYLSRNCQGLKAPLKRRAACTPLEDWEVRIWSSTFMCITYYILLLVSHSSSVWTLIDKASSLKLDRSHNIRHRTLSHMTTVTVGHLFHWTLIKESKVKIVISEMSAVCSKPCTIPVACPLYQMQHCVGCGPLNWGVDVRRICQWLANNVGRCLNLLWWPVMVDRDLFVSWNFQKVSLKVWWLHCVYNLHHTVQYLLLIQAADNHISLGMKHQDLQQKKARAKPINHSYKQTQEWVTLNFKWHCKQEPGALLKSDASCGPFWVWALTTGPVVLDRQPAN